MLWQLWDQVLTRFIFSDNTLGYIQNSQNGEVVWFFKIRLNRTFSLWPKILPKCIFGRPLNSLFYVNPIAEVAIGKLSESAETDLPSFTQLLHSENQNEGGGKMQRHWLLISIIGKRPSFWWLRERWRLSLICGFSLSQIGRRNQ